MSILKFTLHTAAVNGPAFNCRPAMDHQLEPEKIYANDVILPAENHPHGMRLWVIGNEFGAMCALWANNEQDAMDEACDLGLLESFMTADQEQTEDDERCALGNAGELHDLTYAWILPVEIVPSRDWQLFCAFAEARGAGYEHLGKL